MEGRHQVSRLEARHHGGFLVFLGEELEGIRPQNGGHMAGTQKAVHPEVLLDQQGPEGGGRGFQQAQQGEVFQALPLSLQHRQGGAGGGGLKPHPQEHHLLFRVGFGQF